MNLSQSVSNVKGVGEKTIPKLNKLNIYTIGDLIYDLPRGFMDLHEPVDSIEGLQGEMIAVKGKIVRGSIHTIKKGRQMTFAKVLLDTNGSTNQQGSVGIMYFNAPYMAKTLDKYTSEEYIFYGYLSDARGGVITQPKVYTTGEYTQMLSELQPVYSLTKGLSNNQLRKYIKAAFDIAVLPGEYLTEDELNTYDMPHFQKALMDIHFPANDSDHMRARRRLAFHEFLTFFLETGVDEASVSVPFDKSMIPVADTVRLMEVLPYELTGAQKRTWDEIQNDMCSGVCMNRMVQGDVGSGKTIIAFLALLLNAANGHQGCMMAPTEVLASQHYEDMCALVEKYNLPIRPRLLIGAVSAANKRAIRAEILSGEANVIIGTNALIQEAVEYKDLTLAITDEQHRFGVKQREALAKEGGSVHVLVMSATPIPRTLAMTMFSGVKMSIIDELPGGRLPIKNCVVKPTSRGTAYKFIREEVAKGHQVYVICPLVEETEGSQLENVIDYAEKLGEVLPDSIRIGYLHGKMKSQMKNEIMDSFAAKNIDVLVSTTVIEVGINVPNATVMMVENADRFGLATLHQLRGRVGRGNAQSYCIFINSSKNDRSAQRLDILNRSNDGFYIADEDLRLRGPGEVQGIRQSGEFGFRIASIYDDASVLETTKEFVDELLLKQDKMRLHEIADSIDEFGFNPVDFRTI